MCFSLVFVWIFLGFTWTLSHRKYVEVVVSCVSWFCGLYMYIYTYVYVDTQPSEALWDCFVVFVFGFVGFM